MRTETSYLLLLLLSFPLVSIFIALSMAKKPSESDFESQDLDYEDPFADFEPSSTEESKRLDCL